MWDGCDSLEVDGPRGRSEGVQAGLEWMTNADWARLSYNSLRTSAQHMEISTTSRNPRMKHIISSSRPI